MVRTLVLKSGKKLPASVLEVKKGIPLVLRSYCPVKKYV